MSSSSVQSSSVCRYFGLKGSHKAGSLLSEEFLIYSFKVTPCNRKYPHDWASCLCGHKGERATRRDLRTHNYLPVACEYAKQKLECPHGDACPHSHNLFEYWLHPKRYKTELCLFRANCDRAVCFFAHSTEELRPLESGLPPAELCWSAGAAISSKHSSQSKAARAKQQAVQVRASPAAVPQQQLLPAAVSAVPAGAAAQQQLVHSKAQVPQSMSAMLNFVGPPQEQQQQVYLQLPNLQPPLVLYQQPVAQQLLPHTQQLLLQAPASQGVAGYSMLPVSSAAAGAAGSNGLGMSPQGGLAPAGPSIPGSPHMACVPAGHAQLSAAAAAAATSPWQQQQQPPQLPYQMQQHPSLLFSGAGMQQASLYTLAPATDNVLDSGVCWGVEGLAVPAAGPMAAVLPLQTASGPAAGAAGAPQGMDAARPLAHSLHSLLGALPVTPTSAAPTGGPAAAAVAPWLGRPPACNSDMGNVSLGAPSAPNSSSACTAALPAQGMWLNHASSISHAISLGSGSDDMQSLLAAFQTVLLAVSEA